MPSPTPDSPAGGAADIPYPGDELGFFGQAACWKRYVARQLSPYLRGAVLEVGAGLGATTEYLLDGRQTAWTCLEPAPDMAAALRRRFHSPVRGVRVTVVHGTTAALDRTAVFDSILYVDVLEHLDDDRQELSRAAALLAPGGAIVALSPAHQWLFTPFDRHVGHRRRYSRRSLRAVTPDCLSLERTWYLDTAGLLASLGNRVWLSQALPTLRQVLFWDRCLVRISRLVDPVLRFRTGKSVVAVWRGAGPPPGPRTSDAP